MTVDQLLQIVTLMRDFRISRFKTSECEIEMSLTAVKPEKEESKPTRHQDVLKLTDEELLEKLFPNAS